MKTIIIKKNEKRDHRIVLSDKKIYFIKSYYEKDINISKLIKAEFMKGAHLSSIINYPKPLKIEGNSIIYEFIDIDCTLYDRINQGIFDYGFIRKAAKFLKKIHENNIIHGDFNTSNIVITKKNKLYFIDASFSKYTNQYRVNFEDKNIYQDISLFLGFLKWIRPSLNKPWHLLNRRKIKFAKNFFLSSYFYGNLEEFNAKLNALMENKFYYAFLRFVNEKQKIYLKIFWRIILTMVITFNRWKYGI